MKKLPKIQIKNISLKRVLPFIIAIFFVPIFVFFVLPTLMMWQARAAATIYWDGGAGTANWSDALNWNTDVVPVAADEVLIDVATTVSITEPITVTSLTLGKSAGTAATVLSFNYDAITLGALTISTGDFILYPGASVTHAAGSGSTVIGKININVQTGNAIISGIVTADAKGYAAGEGLGAGTDGVGGAGGGAYGGNGGAGRTQAGGIGYGSYTQPTDLGSGGGIYGASNNAAGGGAIKITVSGTATISGTITSDGAYSAGTSGWNDIPGGGSGGSIWITAGTLTGAGNIKANGGGTRDATNDGGGGGGGRIALYYTNDTSSFVTLATNGGVPGATAKRGGAGTIYKKAASATNGDLIIKNDSSWSVDISTIALTTLATATIDNLTLSNYAKIEYSNTLSVISTFTLSSNSYFKNAGTVSTNTLNISGSGWYYNELASTTTYSTINWTGGIISDNGGTMSLVSGGGALTIPATSTLAGNTERSFSSITINGTLTHDPNGIEPINMIVYTSTGNLTVNAGGSINVDGKGYAAGEGPGAGTDGGGNGGSGAGYGGVGGIGQNFVGGSSYGSYIQPSDLGSGGGISSGGGYAGGGAIKLTVTGTTTISGSVSANGAFGAGTTDRKPGGGSGGSIWINTGTLTGTGNVTANGGKAYASQADGGGGGGGRVALYYTTNTSSFTTLSANGGVADDVTYSQYGGAGTIYKKAASATNGDLIIDNNGSGWNTAKDKIALTPLTNITLDNLTVTDFASIEYNNTMSVVSALTLSNNSHIKNTGSISTNTLNISGSGWYYNELASNTTYSTINWTGGIISDNGGTMSLVSGGGALTIPATSTLAGNTERSFSSITINGTLTHDPNTDLAVNKIVYTVSGNFTLNSGGQVNLNEKGYAALYGPGAGVGSSGGGSGAGYGGQGGYGNGITTGRASYGSYSQPTDLGSGGSPYGGNNPAGGGAIKLTVTGTATINGPIAANGGYGNGSSDRAAGGGSGGSIWISAGTLTGTGSINANGGDTRDTTSDAGGGGGGRIAIYYTTDTSNFSALSARGGFAGPVAQYGGAGTIYKKSTTQTNGDLIIRNNTSWSTVISKIAFTPIANLTIDNLTVDSYSNIEYASSLTATTVSVTDKSYFKNVGTVSTQTLNINTSGVYVNEMGSNTTYSTINWTGGILTDNGGTISLFNGDLVIPANATLVGNTQRTLPNIVVNGILTHDTNTTEPLNRIEYTSLGNLEVTSTGQINVDGKGFAGSEGPGAGTDSDAGAGGGAHGGNGGNGQSGVAGGIAYGDALQPITLGSGGGTRSAQPLTPGGGAVKLIVNGTTTVNGAISADGTYANSSNDRIPGGGAGGSIWLTTSTLTGTGTIKANGGAARDWNYDGGGGGGGRIALYYKTDTSNLTILSANGGTSGAAAQPGGIGTIYEGGIPTDPVNLTQLKADGITGIGIGSGTNESSIKIRMQMSDPNATDSLTPQVEFVPLGTAFSNVATNNGTPVAYSGSGVTGEVEVTGLADGSSYHWQARVCDSINLCSNWVSFGNNAESEADVRVVMNTNPNSPTIPTSSFYINGQYTNNLQPTLGFVLSDPNTVDSVGFIIEVSTFSDFNTTIISYTSAMAAQGTQSFTVGQAAGTGTYTTGAVDQTLSTGDYYWRVKAVDDKAGSSDWSVAPGTPSFKIDLSRPTNASNVYMKSSIASTNQYTLADGNKWFRRNDLYFAWDAASDVQGIKGYCLYVGTDPNGDPATNKGLLGSSPVSTTGTTCQFITDGTEVDFSNSALRSYEWLTSSNDPYYFKVKAIDIANNTYVGADDTNYVSFNFDNTAPQNVTAISTPSIAFSSAADMFFSWSTGTAGSSDDHSGVLGFQYAINTKDTWWGNAQDTFTGLTYSPMNRLQPLYLPTEVHSSIQLGQNTVYFRVLDNAGNYSELRTAILNYGGEAPSFAQGAEVTVTPAQNTTNTFAFSWPAAQASTGNTVATYYYMINTPPPVSYATITSNSATYIATTSTSIAETVIPGLRKGANTIYIAVVDNAGNYSSSNVISATFYLNSDLPDSPADVTVADISIKDVSIWRAAVVWSEPEYKGTGSLTYHVYRSEDATNWTEIATTTGLTYVDTVPESKEYFWRVATTDNSDESINSPSVSNGASLTPRGKYLEAPTLTSGPASSSISTTKATISWTTSRNSDSKVAFGLSSRNYFESESYNSTETTEHKIVLSNLTPGTEYYYTAKWTDEDGNTGESQELSFSTEPAPEVKNVRISNRGVSSSMINFTTIKASSVKIYYGISTSFGGVKEIATSKLETSYSLQLDQLQDGTKYYFKINTMDEEGKEYEGTILDFETLPRPKVFNIKVMQVAKTAQSALLVSWNSNTEISSVVTYYPSSNQSLMRDNVDLELISGEHEMLIKGLFPDTEYSIQVRGNDLIGNEAVSEVINIKTSRDSRAPQISAMTLEGTNVRLTDGGTTSQLIVSWNTDEPSTSQVEYGEGSGDNYNQLTQEDKDLSYNHVVIISGLTPSKVYHLRAISADSAGNITKSIDTVTITPKATDNALYLVITTLKEAFGFIDQIDNLK